jgi:hypothetical protein
MLDPNGMRSSTPRMTQSRCHRLATGLALGAVMAMFGQATGGEGSRRSEPPEENVSYVPADDDTVRRLWDAVTDAVRARNWVATVRSLQRIAESPKEIVAALDGADAGVFEGADVVAHHRVMSIGVDTAKAYEDEFGSGAKELLDQAVARRDLATLERVAARYLPSSSGRRAALLLADLALERGDRDGAFAWLDRLEDLEDVSAASLAEETKRWRSLRLDRAAAALATTAEARGRIRVALEALPPHSPTDGPAQRAVLRAGVGGLRDGDLYAPPPSDDWPTAGGGPSRAVVAPALPPGVAYASNQYLLEGGTDLSPTDPFGEVESRGKASRPSPWLPPRAIVFGGRVIASDGRSLRVWTVATQRRDAPAISLVPNASAAGPRELARGEEARRRWGLIEGFGLTAARTADGDVVYANVPSEHASTFLDDEDEDPDLPRPDPLGAGFERPPRPGESGRAPRGEPGDQVVAVRLDDEGGRILWTAGGSAKTPGLPEGTGLFGTPLLYQGSLHVAGLRRGKNGRIEAWHVALDPATGAARSTTRLGEGAPLRLGRPDEAIPTSCAASHGRVYLVTTLGIAAAVDARSGRTRWSYRYDRGRPDNVEPGRRLQETKESSDRKSTFANHPPLVGAGGIYLTPTDSRYVLALYDRPLGARRQLLQWKRFRDIAWNCVVEHLAGVTEGRGDVPPTLVAVGQGFNSDPLHDEYACVIAIDPYSPSGTVDRWQRALPFGDLPEPFGVAMLTETEVLVPSAKGIARYRLKDGADVPPLDDTTIPASAALYPAEHLYGNLVPVPGRGFVAVNEAYLSFWLAPAK